jgi:hypothetical protein
MQSFLYPLLCQKYPITMIAATMEPQIAGENTPVGTRLPAVLDLRHITAIHRKQRDLAHLVVSVNPQKLSRNGKELPGLYTLAYSEVPENDLGAVLSQLAHSVEASSIEVEVFETGGKYEVYRKI